MKKESGKLGDLRCKSLLIIWFASSRLLVPLVRGRFLPPCPALVSSSSPSFPQSNPNRHQISKSFPISLTRIFRFLRLDFKLNSLSLRFPFDRIDHFSVADFESIEE